MQRKQTICLNMIVKNEGHIIEETLNSVYKYIDYYVINDTGSTDDTKEKIKNFFDSKGINGEIVDHEFRTCKCHHGKYKKYNWFHFGWNRSYALDKCIGKSDYILIMDADDLIVGELPIPQKMEAECYDLKIGSNFVYYRPLLIKNDKRLGWKFIGGLHEYLDSSIRTTLITRLEGNYYVESRRLGDRSKDNEKYKKDVKIFKELLIDEPLNERYIFYCAQSYYDCCDYKNAIKYYEKRILRGGSFIEEIYYSLYRIGLCKKLLNYPEEDIKNAFLKCHKYYPRRAEPLYELAVYYRINKKYNEGYKYAKKGLLIPFPSKDVLFISKDVYDYKLLQEAAVCAACLGKKREACEIWEKILQDKKYHSSEHNIFYNNYHVMKRLISSKPILCFYVGYIPDYTKSLEGVYGSELALKKISELLTEYYDVYIFGTSFTANIINNVNYLNSNKLQEFGEKNEIDILIISRYIHYFLEFSITAKKTYLWLHDVLVQPYWNGVALPREGKYLLENVIDRIDGIITLCEWHKQNVLKHYNIDPNKIHIIGNGIDINNFNHKVEKIKNRFIYMSNPKRGLVKLVEHFHTIRKHIPDAELIVYRGIEEFTDKVIIDEMAKYDYIKFKGKLPNDQLIPEIMKAEYWYYPTDFYETYCISALEAQAAGCICIATNLGALETTIENRGILLNKQIYSDEYWKEALDNILILNNNSDLKESYIKKGKEWAYNQTWNNRLKEWINLFKK